MKLNLRTVRKQLNFILLEREGIDKLESTLKLQNLISKLCKEDYSTWTDERIIMSITWSDKVRKTKINKLHISIFTSRSKKEILLRKREKLLIINSFKH